MKYLTPDQKILLSILLLLIFIVSLAYSFYFRISPTVDARAYDAIAQNIVAGNGYRELFDAPLVKDNAILRVGPGYPLFLALLYFPFGHHYEVVWIIQALIHTLTAFLIFLIAQKIFGKDRQGNNVGFVATLFVGFSPDLITMSGMLMAETLGIFLVTLTTFVFFGIFNKERALCRDVFMAGIVLGLATLVRTPALFLFFPLGIYFLMCSVLPEAADTRLSDQNQKEPALQTERKNRWSRIRKGAPYLGFFSVGIALVLFPWIVRNYTVYRAFVPTNLAYGIDLAAGNHPGASGELEPYSHNDETIAELGPLDGTRKLTKEALIFIIRHPVEFFSITMRRISIYFSFARPLAFWPHLRGMGKAITLVLSALYAAVLFFFGFLSIGVLLNKRKQHNKKVLWLFSMLVMMPLSVVFIIVETRYRILAYPFFALFAGYGTLKFFERAIPFRYSLAVAAIILFNTSMDVLQNINRVLERILTP